MWTCRGWVRLGTLASEMESATLFVVASALKVRCGTCLLTMANQERAKAALPNPVMRDTEAAVRVAVAAMRRLMQNGRGKQPYRKEF